MMIKKPYLYDTFIGSNQKFTTEHVKNVQYSRFFHVLFLHKLSNSRIMKL